MANFQQKIYILQQLMNHQNQLSTKLDLTSRKLIIAHNTFDIENKQQSEQLSIYYGDTFKIISGIHFCKVQSLKLLAFKHATWKNIICIELGYSYYSQRTPLGDKGCKYLSRIQFGSLKKLNITDNAISNIGLMHLSKARWRNLSLLFMSSQYLSKQGLFEIGKCNWSLGLIQMNNYQLTLVNLVQLFLFQHKLLRQLHIKFSSSRATQFFKLLQSKMHKVQIYMH